MEIKNLQFSKLWTNSDLCYVKNIDNFYVRVLKKSTRPISCNIGFFSGSGRPVQAERRPRPVVHRWVHVVQTDRNRNNNNNKPLSWAFILYIKIAIKMLRKHFRPFFCYNIILNICANIFLTWNPLSYQRNSAKSIFELVLYPRPPDWSDEKQVSFLGP